MAALASLAAGRRFDHGRFAPFMRGGSRLIAKILFAQRASHLRDAYARAGGFADDLRDHGLMRVEVDRKNVLRVFLGLAALRAHLRGIAFRNTSRGYVYRLIIMSRGLVAVGDIRGGKDFAADRALHNDALVVRAVGGQNLFFPGRMAKRRDGLKLRLVAAAALKHAGAGFGAGRRDIDQLAALVDSFLVQHHVVAQRLAALNGHHLAAGLAAQRAHQTDTLGLRARRRRDAVHKVVHILAYVHCAVAIFADFFDDCFYRAGARS